MNPKIKITIYDGISHNSWDITYSKNDIHDWLLSKSFLGGKCVWTMVIKR